MRGRITVKVAHMMVAFFRTAEAVKGGLKKKYVNLAVLLAYAHWRPHSHGRHNSLLDSWRRTKKRIKRSQEYTKKERL